VSEARDREAEPAVRLRVLPDAAALVAAAAEDVAQTVRRKPDATLLLPTGTTPLGMYRRLVEKYSSGDISFSRTTFFNLDEYLGLRPDHPASYRVYMQENFYGLVDAAPERVHVPDGSASDPQAECEKYESLIQGSGGVDLCVLGIGRNGHIGFNEPGASRGSRTRVVRLADSTRRVNATDFDGGLAPQRAISVGMRTIYESEEVLLLASGANKAQAVAAAARGEISPEVPASMLRDHPCASFLLDADAASALDWEGT
jgi:glucosamine-6-phosphate deaminase